ALVRHTSTPGKLGSLARPLSTFTSNPAPRNAFVFPGAAPRGGGKSETDAFGTPRRPGSQKTKSRGMRYPIFRFHSLPRTLRKSVRFFFETPRIRSRAVWTYRFRLFSLFRGSKRLFRANATFTTAFLRFRAWRG